MKKKGFTLIELLAVIVILAIIALIATPIVLNIIKDSKESATLRSGNFYLDAVEKAIARENDTTGTLKNTRCFIEENGVLICQGYEKELKIEINGEKPNSGKVVIKDNKIDDIELYYEDKLVIKDEDNKLIYSEETFEIVKDSNPGIICGEGTTEDLNEETCYIKSIEDLVELSTLVNKGKTFENKKVELVHNLDFECTRSYGGKKIDKNLITDVGFNPIGYTQTRPFKGVFEGNNKTIKGLYINRPTTSYIGLFGYVDGVSISNIKLEDVSLIGKSSIGSLIGTNKSAIVDNINLENINLKSNGGEYDNIGGLIGSNSATKINNIKANNINIISGGPSGGIIGINSGELVENINIENVYINGKYYNLGGIIGQNSNASVKTIVGNNIKIESKARYVGGLIGVTSTSVKNIKLNNVDVTGNDYVGGVIGSGGFVLSNCKVSGKAKGGILVGLVTGRSYSTDINTVVVSGSASGGDIFNGFIGYQYWDVSSLQYVSAVNMTQKLLSIGGEVKKLTDMGIASKSEYEAMGFEFESTEENEAYWYFNEDDELDLMIKKVD